MSFPTLDGIPMATRCGALDPGLLLYFLQQENMLPDALSDLLYHRSGLFELSGISGDTRDLLECNTPQACEALEVFTLRIAGEIARLASTLGGLDSLIFTVSLPTTLTSTCKASSKRGQRHRLSIWQFSTNWTAFIWRLRR